MFSIYRLLSKKAVIAVIMVVMTFASSSACKYSYSFDDTPISQAIICISKNHPDASISFIYKEIDNYKTTVEIHTDDIYEALRQIIGSNPISIIKKDGNYYIEALQHGKFCYTGQVIGSDNEPVVAATAMLLAPKDSTVITYGITDSHGRFSIPCDKREIILKLTCLGYKPTYKNCKTFTIGNITMELQPVLLQAVSTEADNAYMYSDRNVYRPTQRQKDASQTATDLLNRMAIPQLNVRLGSDHIETASGQPVAMFIDFVPATANQLKMMRMSDVSTVEYMEYPSDPRFQGNKFIINFRTAKYEYGGYVKVLVNEKFIANSGLLQANARIVHKRMTCDIMGYGYYINNNHFGSDQTETFKLPQEDGSIICFQRQSKTEKAEYKNRNYETSFRALYATDKITANSLVALGIDNSPHNDNNGSVQYSNDLFDQSQYASQSDTKAKYLTYNGYYHFILPKNSSLTASLNYLYSHTDQQYTYNENSFTPILNGANDNTNRANARLMYSKQLSGRHSFMAFVNGLYEHNNTDYSGSVNALDKATTKFGQLGASYNFSGTAFAWSFGFGWNWISTALNQNTANSDFPYIDASLRYVPNHKNSFGGVFHYSVWPPSSNYKSENVIQVSPFLWHTGNPLIKSSRSYDFGVNYTFIPSNSFNMTVFANAWLVGNRAAFVYTATNDGVIRSIQQPIGKFRHYNYGINASTTQLDGKLQISSRVTQLYVHNGKPYDTNRSNISYYIQASYYVGQFNFALAYQSEQATDNYDSMSGIWTKSKGNLIVQAGWSNSSLNIRLTAQNLQRWNWRSSHDVMNSEYYSVNRWVNDASCHALVQLSATYTIGFGKKVNQGNDISKQAGASSGILR